MPNVSSFGAQTDNAVVSGTVTDRQMVIPEVPPQGLMSVGPRVTPNFVKPREWNDKTTYHFFDAVRDNAGNAYVATKPVVPEGTPLSDENYWFLWADPDTRFDDLNETVKTFNQRITQNANDIATKAPINHASEETIYGIGNAINYGHVKLAADDTPMTSDANSGVAATPNYVNKSIDEKNKKREFFISDYAPDFNKAFAAIMQKITDGGTIVIPAEIAIDGDCTINKKNVSIVGGGTFKGSLIIDTPLDINDAPSDSSGVIVSGMKFRGEIGIDIKHAPGLKVESCDFNNENICVNCTATAKNGQYNAQMIFNANTMRSNGYGFYFSETVKNDGNNYLTADCIITNNTLNNKVTNIHIVNSDGVTISNNIMFLSLGGATKKNHIYLDEANFNIISNNELFESGEEAIKITRAVQTSLVTDNNIIWPAQTKRVPAIDIQTNKSDTYFNVSDNTIERSSSTAIKINSDYPKVSNNYIILPGDVNHIISGEPDSNAYGIELPEANYAYLIGNIVTGPRHNNVPKMNNGLKFGIINSSQIEATPFFTTLKRRNISNANQILNVKNEIPCYFTQVQLDITRDQFLVNTDKDTSFTTGFVICFGSTHLKIDENIVVNSNHIRQYVIMNGEITWFTETQIAAK